MLPNFPYLKDFFDRIACAQKLHNSLNGDPSSRNDRAPITNIRMNVYSICHNSSLDIGLIVLAPVQDGSVFPHPELFDSDLVCVLGFGAPLGERRGHSDEVVRE